MTLVPFNAELNRLVLVVKGGTAANYAVTWGGETTIIPPPACGCVNLAEDFTLNPFSAAFAKVEPPSLKSKIRDPQIKELFHGPAGKADADGKPW